MFKIRTKEDYDINDKSNRLVEALHKTDYVKRRRDKKILNQETGETLSKPVYDKICSMAEAEFHTTEDAQRAMITANLSTNDYKIIIER